MPSFRRHIVFGAVALSVLHARAARADVVTSIPIADSDGSYGILHAGASYFTTYDDASGLALRRSDGTAAGTVEVANLGGASAIGSSVLLASASTPAGLFVVVAEIDGESIWVTDGTKAGTRKVTKFAGPGGNGRPFYALAHTGARLVVARAPFGGGKLWRLDPANGALAELAAIATGPLDTLGGRVYYVGNDKLVHGTDGVTTSPAIDHPGRAPNAVAPAQLVSVCNGALVFAYMTATDVRLARYDGASSSTVIDGASTLVCAGQTAFAFPRTADKGREPWVIDAAGARLLSDLAAGPTSSIADEDLGYTHALGERLLTTAMVKNAQGVPERKLHVSKASKDGLDVVAGENTRYQPVGTLGGRVYFCVGDFDGPKRLAYTDGSALTFVPTPTFGSIGVCMGGSVVGSRLLVFANKDLTTEKAILAIEPEGLPGSPPGSSANGPSTPGSTSGGSGSSAPGGGSAGSEDSEPTPGGEGPAVTGGGEGEGGCQAAAASAPGSAAGLVLAAATLARAARRRRRA